MTLLFGGDVIPHNALKTQAAHRLADGGVQGWHGFLENLASRFGAADFAIVNLETPLVEIQQPESGPFIFSAPPALANTLRSQHVSVATFANNHCLDQHAEGIVSTRNILADAGVLSAGCDIDEAHAWTPLVLEKEGFTIGLLPVTRWLNGFSNRKKVTPHVPVLAYADTPVLGSTPQALFFARVAEAASTVDALIVVMHWGAEYRSRPAPEDRLLAQQILAAGAFAIVGHHPHQLQPIEMLAQPDGGTHVVAFSMGNLLSAQDASNRASLKRDGLLLGLTLQKSDAGVGLKATQTIPLTTVWKNNQVQVVVLQSELQQLKNDLDVAVDARQKKRLRNTIRIEEAREVRILTLVRSLESVHP
jgi:poly-gamma-glutamate capsule biosynthesis protein CapA/YwtB (metallophosphatase superfamily)